MNKERFYKILKAVIILFLSLVIIGSLISIFSVELPISVVFVFLGQLVFIFFFPFLVSLILSKFLKNRNIVRLVVLFLQSIIWFSIWGFPSEGLGALGAYGGFVFITIITIVMTDLGFKVFRREQIIK